MDSLVSVILPVCNAEDYLHDCLDSLLKQKHQNIEIIAIDDDSKDKSVQILKNFRKIDKRIQISTNVKRYGLAITLNRAIKKAKGDFITFMNPHDVNSIWRIKKQLEFLANNPKIVAVGTQAISIDETGKKLEKSALPQEHEFIYKNFLQGFSVHFETMMINKKLIPKDLLYFKKNKYPYVYIETFVKLFRYGHFANLMQHLYFHRGKPVTASRFTSTERFFKRLQVTFRSITMYDYKPSFYSIFQPFINRRKALFQ